MVTLVVLLPYYPHQFADSVCNLPGCKDWSR